MPQSFMLAALDGCRLLWQSRPLPLAAFDTFEALKAEGRTADDTAKAVQAEFQAQHPEWPRANGLAAAARSAYAEAR